MEWDTDCEDVGLQIQADLGEGHVNIINAIEAILTQQHLALVLEYASEGSLTGYVAERWQTGRESGLFLTENEARYFFRVAPSSFRRNFGGGGGTAVTSSHVQLLVLLQYSFIAVVVVHLRVPTQLSCLNDCRNPVKDIIRKGMVCILSCQNMGQPHHCHHDCVAAM